MKILYIIHTTVNQIIFSDDFFFYLLINSAILSKESNNFQSIVGAISCFFLSFAKFLFPFHKYRQ